MEKQNQAKAIIEKHIEAMIEELSISDSPIGWIGDNAAQILTDTVFSVMSYGVDVEQYMKGQDMIKE